MANNGATPLVVAEGAKVLGVVELKSVDAVARVHEAQVLTYMKLAQLPVGLLINFNVEVLATGIKRFKLAEFASNHPKFFSGPSGPLE